jgi:hypothetical protein
MKCNIYKLQTLDLVFSRRSICFCRSSVMSRVLNSSVKRKNARLDWVVWMENFQEYDTDNEIGNITWVVGRI